MKNKENKLNLFKKELTKAKNLQDVQKLLERAGEELNAQQYDKFFLSIITSPYPPLTPNEASSLNTLYIMLRPTQVKTRIPAEHQDIRTFLQGNNYKRAYETFTKEYTEEELEKFFSMFRKLQELTLAIEKRHLILLSREKKEPKT